MTSEIYNELLLTEQSGMSVLSSFVKAALTSELDLEQISAKLLPLRGREKWFEIEMPTLNDKPVQDSWHQFNKHRQTLEVLSWVEASRTHELNKIFLDTIVKFQCDKTILSDHDAFPLPWTAFVYQAAVAYYNSAWLVASLYAGNENRYIRLVGEIVNYWLESAANLNETKSGDCLLLHFFCKALVNYHAVLTQKLGEAETRLNSAMGILVAAQKALDKAPFWQRRMVEQRVRNAESEVEKAKRRLHNTKAAHTELGNLVKRWCILSPISSVLIAYHDDNKITPIPRLIVFGDKQAEGLQIWITRELIKNYPPPHIESIAQCVNCIFPIQTSGDCMTWTEETWIAGICIIRFYTLWTLLCPTISVVEHTFSNVSGEQREQYKAFFSPWKSVCRAYSKIEGKNYRDIRDRFKIEYCKLYNSLNQLEYYDGKVIKTLEEKLKALFNHFLKVIKLETKTVEVEEIYAG